MKTSIDYHHKSKAELINLLAEKEKHIESQAKHIL